MRAHGSESVVLRVAEGDVIEEELLVPLRAEDGDDMGGQGRLKKQGHELSGKPHTGVIEQGHEFVESFCCFYLRVRPQSLA